MSTSRVPAQEKARRARWETERSGATLSRATHHNTRPIRAHRAAGSAAKYPSLALLAAGVFEAYQDREAHVYQVENAEAYRDSLIERLMLPQLLEV